MSANTGWTLRPETRLTARAAEQVRTLARRAAGTDGVEALSEVSLLHLTSPGSRHLLAYADASDEELAGYAQVWDDGSTELVVDPSRRRQGVGTALWEAAREAGAARAWAHGNIDAATAFATSLGLVDVRELHLMGRALTDDDALPPELPDWVTVQSYADRQDPQEWVALNARAFADHPEQGRLTVSDFQARAAEPWFDPEGLLYLLDEKDTPDGPPIAFHWTKAEPGKNKGEVYAVGVDPAYQGRGLAGPLTALGVAHLARQGLARVELYVDGDNTRALRTYRKAGFADVAVDVVYAPRANAVRMDA